MVVSSKHNDDEQWVWESEAGATFSVSKDTSGDKLTRGTRIQLHLKKDQHEYLETRRLKDLVKRYSEFVGFPISLLVEKTEEKEIVEEEETTSRKDQVTAERKETATETLSQEGAPQETGTPDDNPPPVSMHCVCTFISILQLVDDAQAPSMTTSSPETAPPEAEPQDKQQDKQHDKEQAKVVGCLVFLPDVFEPQL